MIFPWRSIKNHSGKWSTEPSQKYDPKNQPSTSLYSSLHEKRRKKSQQPIDLKDFLNPSFGEPQRPQQWQKTPWNTLFHAFKSSLINFLEKDYIGFPYLAHKNIQLFKKKIKSLWRTKPKLPVNWFLTAKGLRRELQTQQREHIALLFRSCTHNPSIGILSAFR